MQEIEHEDYQIEYPKLKNIIIIIISIILFATFLYLAINLISNNPKYKSSKVEQINDVFEIREKFFIQNVNDVYLNKDKYIGKNIKIEGLMKSDICQGKDCKMVLRYGPGCCFNDQYAGFQIYYDGPFPEDDEWIEVIGVVEPHELNNIDLVKIKVISIKVLEERGLEKVTH